MKMVKKNAKAPPGKIPTIVLANPRFPHNVAGAIRMASAYGLEQVWMTGDRVKLDPEKGERLPREERMKGYGKVELVNCDYPFDAFPHGTVPVAVEVRDTSEQLPFFEHPENAAYVFGPEDGSIPKVMLRHCQRFVIIPTAHCLNLATAIGTVLYDRRAKRQLAGLEPIVSTPDLMKGEQRGWWVAGQEGEIL